MIDLVIKSNAVVTPAGMVRAYVLVADGRITDITGSLPEDCRCEVLDVGDKALLPGVIDPHVHINEPGRTDWEGFDTATKSAIAGGLTTLVDMPLNASPVTTTVTAFEAKMQSARTYLHTHCGFWGGVVPGNERDIAGLIDKGVLGFKAFLTHSGIDEFPNVTEEDLRKVMPIIARHHLPLLVHAELSTDKIYQPSKNDVLYRYYLASRPKTWEDNAIALMIRLCEAFDCHVHIVHLSSADSIAQIAAAKASGLPLTVETAQHYLYFNAEQIADRQTQFKCAPPIREKFNNDLLWQALHDGVIDFVATDHSPAPPALKQPDSGNFMTAWGGIASLQFALPVLWTAAKARNAGLCDLARWLSEKPAILAGLHHRKGKIAKGYDADLVVFDPEKRWTVTQDAIFHKHKPTPYLNETLCGMVEQTYLAGVNVFDNGSFTRLNRGKIITRMHD